MILVCLIPVTHAFFCQPRAAARARSLILSRVVGTAEVVILRLEVKLLTIPTPDRSLLINPARECGKHILLRYLWESRTYLRFLCLIPLHIPPFFPSIPVHSWLHADVKHSTLVVFARLDEVRTTWRFNPNKL